jgi:hypothetical protein
MQSLLREEGVDATLRKCREASSERSGRGREARKPDRAQQQEISCFKLPLIHPERF